MKVLNKRAHVPMVIYHGTCADGFMAALAFWRKYPHWEYVPAAYGPNLTLPEGIKDRVIFMVDFCYPLALMQELADKAMHISVLDHHKSAAENMAAFDLEKNLHVDLEFDMNQSGAGMAWRFLYEDHEIPDLVRRVEDRDLWRFAYPDTRAVQAALFSYPYDFEVWNALLDRPLAELEQEGTAIMRQHMKDVHEWIEIAVNRATIAGYDVPILNAQYQHASEAGNLLAQGEPFAAVYYDHTGTRKWSLRSVPGGVDVSAVAAKYGGGGHFHASGFNTAIGWLGD